MSPWVLDRDAPLHLYGPTGLRAMTDHLRDAYAEDARIRRSGGEPPHSEEGRRTVVHESAPGIVYRADFVTVTPVAVEHRAWSHACGYTAQTRGRSMASAADYAPAAPTRAPG